MPLCPAFLPCSTPPDAQRSNGTQLMEDFMRRQQGGATPGAEVRAGAAAAAAAAAALPCLAAFAGLAASCVHCCPATSCSLFLNMNTCTQPRPAQGSELAGASEAELQEKAKRKGRFRYVEDDYAAAAAAGMVGALGPGGSGVAPSKGTSVSK